ncbi:Uma2 family endonuclease [Dyadobacter sp. NIV53]|uniref:Uma2 family endonuclease n=1 Tax=Dyadobacter sp. NIV53 TaxID=2861765 RepID=UPI001C8808AD|nr:Uma2 family endonuclease [Dyadobacter sp. NIV53]
MMPTATQTIYTETEYFQMEEKAVYKSEYFRGEIFMMAGGTPNHNRIKENVSIEIGIILKRRKSCRSYSSDQRIHIPENSLYTYPDIAVICGPNKYSEKDKNTIINPTVIIEVVFDSTGAYDRGDKFRHYRDIESLQEYILVNSINVGVEIYRRTEDNHWLLAESAYKLSDTTTIQSIEASLLLSDLYDGTENVKEGWITREA